MAIFSHRVHLPLRKLHEMEKVHQARDWFWLDGYEIDQKTEAKKKAKKKDQKKMSGTNKWVGGEFPEKQTQPDFAGWEQIKKPCIDPEHDFPSMLCIPPGETFTHKCPGCGHETAVQNTIVYH